MQKVHFWNNFAVKVSVKFYLLSFWLIPDEPKEEGGNVFFFSFWMLHRLPVHAS